MSRPVFPFLVKDVSSFARSLRHELETHDQNPSHLQLLNMLVRSAGYQNYQHFRKQSKAQNRLEQEHVPFATAAVDLSRIERVVRRYNDSGLLTSWPTKRSHQLLCLWVFWSHIPKGHTFSEAQINDILNAHHTFHDHALLRRELYDMQLLHRTIDGREYHRIETRPPDEALTLMQYVNKRMKG